MHHSEISHSSVDLQFQLLCDALSRHETDLEIHRILKNLDTRGYNGIDVIDNVRDKLGSSGVLRLMAFSHAHTVSAF